MKHQAAPQRPILRMLFFLYSGIMLWLLLFRSPGWVPGMDYRLQLLENVNLIPFHTIGNYLKVVFFHTNDSAYNHSLINLLGNTLLFIPAGAMIPALWPKTRPLFRFLPLCVCIIFPIEVLQLLTLLGSLDIDDLILNVLGMLAGFLLFRWFGKK